MSDTLHIEYVPLADCIAWDRNPKLHDIGSITTSIRRHGFKDPMKYEPSLNHGEGGIVEGNGRAIALQMMWREDPDSPPRGVALAEDGAWAVPVLFGVDADSEAAAEAYALDHNSLTLLGGEGITPWDVARMYEPGYTDLLGELLEQGELPVSVDEEDWAALVSVPPIVDDKAQVAQQGQSTVITCPQCGHQFAPNA